MRPLRLSTLVFAVLALTTASSHAIWPRMPWWAFPYGRAMHAQMLARKAAEEAAAAAAAQAAAAQAAAAQTTAGDSAGSSISKSGSGVLVLVGSTLQVTQQPITPSNGAVMNLSGITTTLSTQNLMLNNGAVMNLTGGVTIDAAANTVTFTNTPLSIIQPSTAFTFNPLINTSASSFSGVLRLDSTVVNGTALNLSTALTGTLTTDTSSGPVTLTLSDPVNGAYTLSNGAATLNIGSTTANAAGDE